ncbi:MAG: DUF58 domain-containing protein [Oscillospiraceae bacterium]|nr:DUF58 domain-containing protein [Oscillospiraceae bacterium]
MRRNRLAYAGIILASIVLTFFQGRAAPYIILYAVLAAPALSLAFLTVTRIRFKYIESIGEFSAVKGDKVSYRLLLINETPFMVPYLTVRFTKVPFFISEISIDKVSLGPFGKKRYEFDFTCGYMGVYDVGVEAFELTDLLGLFKVRYSPLVKRTVTVYPRIVQLTKLRSDPFLISETQPEVKAEVEDMTAVSHIRDYAYGDSLRRIHWKLSGKLQRLVSKNYENTAQMRLSVFVDYNVGLAKEREYVSDRIAESAIAVIYHGLSNWMGVDFLYHGEGALGRMEASTPSDFAPIYEFVARKPFDSDASLSDVMDIYFTDGLRGSSIFLITSCPDLGIFDKVCRLASADREITLIYVAETDAEVTYDELGELVRQLSDFGVKLCLICKDGDTKASLEDVA